MAIVATTVITLILISGLATIAAADPGACCLPTECQFLEERDCADLGGDFLPGAECLPDPCFSACEVEPPVLDFGGVAAQDSYDLSFIVRNTGTKSISEAFSESCPEFGFLTSGSFSLAPGEEAELSIRFTPSAIEDYNCEVSGTLCDGPTLLGRGSAPPECELDPPALDFGSIGVGQFRNRTVTLTNVGDGVLAGAALDCNNFRVIGDPSYELRAGESTQLTVRFLPVSEGPSSCTMNLGDDCDGLALSGIGAPEPICAVTPEIVEFGEVFLGQPTDAQFLIENAGGGTLAGNVLESCAPFFVVGTTGFALESGQSQSFTLRVIPELEGELECEIDLGPCGMLLARANAVPAPECDIDPSVLNLGDIPLGSSVVDSFVVTNRGGGLLQGSFLSSCQQLAVLGDPSYSLAADESATILVEFTPLQLGGSVCAVEGAGCEAVLVRAVGVPGPICRLEPEAVDLDLVPVGSHVEFDVRIANEGGAVLEGEFASACNELTFAVAGSIDPPTSTLAYALGEGEELAVRVRYTATELGTVDCRILTGAACPEIAVVGTVESPPECGLSADELDFGTVFVGETRTLELSLTNDGGSRLQGDVLPECPGFFIVDHPDGLTYDLISGESVVFNLEFAPGAGGNFDCSLDLGGICGVVNLLAESQDAPVCSIEPATLDFGSVEVGVVAPRDVTIRNDGGGTLEGTLSSPCPEFIVAGDADYSLGPGESAVRTVMFAPSVTGSVECEIGAGPRCSSITATGRGEGPICVVSPTFLDFGVVLPETSAERSFFVSNAGGSTLQGSIPRDCGFFTVIGDREYSLRRGETKEFRVRFESKGFGDFYCELDLSTCPDLELLASGGEPPRCEISTSELDFGVVDLGASARRSFTITNRGDGPLVGRVEANCTGFQVIGDRDYELLFQESATFEVELTAFEEGLFQCSLSLGPECDDLLATATVREPLGACCYSDGSCVIRSSDACDGSGGLEWTRGIGCQDVVCVSRGACCLPSGECELLSESECSSRGGIDWSPDTLCEEIVCPGLGACCFLNGECRLTLEAACDGDFGGDGSICESTPCEARGACCFADGSCTLTTQGDCTPEGGLSWSEATRCENVTCEPVGACCLESSCSVTTVAGCLGDYLGDAVDCEPLTCVPQGACCFPDESCRIRHITECSGVFVGEDSLCEPGLCAPKVETVAVVQSTEGPEIQVTTTTSAVESLQGWYRRGGEVEYRQVRSFSEFDGLWTSSFDSQDLSERGLEYYLSYVDLQLGLRVQHGSADVPRRLRLRDEVSFPWPPFGSYRMISAPTNLDDADEFGTLLASRLGATGGRTWRMGTWDPASQSYRRVTAESPAALEPGRAYWMVIASEPGPWRLQGETHFPPEGSFTYALAVEPGWNMLGNPAAYTLVSDPSRCFIVDQGNVMTLERATGGTSPRVSPLYLYDDSPGNPTAPYVVEPEIWPAWHGAWIENRTEQRMTLLLASFEAGEFRAPTLASWAGDLSGPAFREFGESSRSESDSDVPVWRAFLSADNGSRRMTLEFGTGGEDGLEGTDRVMPPDPPGEPVLAHWVGPGSTVLLGDVRSGDSVSIWTARLNSSVPLTVSFRPLKYGEGGSELGGLEIRKAGDSSWRSLWEVGDWNLPAGMHGLEIRSQGPTDDPPDFPPDFPADPREITSVTLSVEPNPIGDEARFYLRLPLSESGYRLSCFDVSGKRVWDRRSESGTAHQTVRWDRRDNEGRPVEAGIYFLRLDVGREVLTRKIILAP